MSGHATQSGIDFQNKVAAVIAVYALADEPLPFLGLPGRVSLTVVELETNAPVDDILVKTSAEGFCFINVKKNVGTSDDPASPLGSVIDQFVRQWITCVEANGEHEWERPLDMEKDRLMLVTGGTKAHTFVAAVSNILTRIEGRHSIQPQEDIATTNSERKAYNALLSLIQFYWNRHTGNMASEAEMAALLGMTRIVFIDPDSTDKAPALSLLRKSVLANPEDAENAWACLVVECQRLARLRSSADRSILRNTLRSSGLQLRDVPELEGDIHRLEAFTIETLRSLRHLAQLQVPTPSGIQSICINRNVTQVLVDSAQHTSMLLISPPGAGKSGTLYWAAKQMQEQGHPVIVIAVDRHPVTRIKELESDIGLNASFFEVLKGWTTSKPGVLFIDALDATRGGPSDRVFQDLIRLMHTEVPGWHVVASVREFDLRFGVEYRELFAGKPVHAEFRSSDFPKVEHLFVQRLAEEELQQVFSISPSMADVYHRATEPLRDLLRNPFNLFLLANILSTGGNVEDLSATSTQVELLDRYWSHRVIGSDSKYVERERLIRFATKAMIEKRVFFVPFQNIAALGDKSIDRLLHDGVLVPLDARGDDIKSVAFSHHMLFDYAVARLILESGQAADLVEQLTASDDNALLLAPAATIVFRMLWQNDDNDRTLFWEKAFNVAGAEGAGAFCRMLPARVAAELTQHLGDFDPITACLRNVDCKHRAAALFLVRHCLGALVSGVVSDQRIIGPTAVQWCRIVRELSEAAIADVGWMLKPVIAQCIETPGRLTLDQKNDLGTAARRLLTFYSGEKYDEGAVIIGIQAVSRTFESDPTQSGKALTSLLIAEHVNKYGHRELFWLAQEFDYLITRIPDGIELLSTLYRAAYCTPLPSRDEQTRMGNSRILGLISNKRQDFEMARHFLEERFAHFVEAQPAMATEALIDAIACCIRDEHQMDKEIREFSFGDIVAHYQKDWSCMWMNHRGGDGNALLHGFIEGFSKVALAERKHDIDEVIRTIALTSPLACIWASLIIVGTANPDTVGRSLVPLLTSPLVLAGFDTRKASGDLLKVLHPLLTPEEKQSIENAILLTDREETQRILLGCLEGANIISKKAKNKLTKLKKEGPLPANREPFSIEAGWAKSEDDWWLKEQGVDLLVEGNIILNHAIRAVEELKPSKENQDLECEHFVKQWETVYDLYQILLKRLDAPEALRMKGWDALAEVARKAAEACETAATLGCFPEIEKMVFGALQDTLWPLPQADPEQEISFARFPSWSSPSPRIAGTAALMAIARAKGAPNSDYAFAIEKLFKDPVPAVRYHILSRINMLFKADPVFMWHICERAFNEERNKGILSSFLNALSRIIRPCPEWITSKLLSLGQSDIMDDAESKDSLGEIYVKLLLRLWLVYDQKEAGQQISTWINNPVNKVSYVNTILSTLRDAILQGDPEHPDPTDEQIRLRSIDMIQTVVMGTVPIFTDLARRPSLNERDEKFAESALRILDGAAREIYYGSGAYDARHPQDISAEKLATTNKSRQRFLKEMKPTLEILSDAAHPSITHHLLQTLEAYISDAPVDVFRLVIRTMVAGGPTGGYHFEKLGTDLFVRIIKRYLADYRFVLTQQTDCREGLMKALDFFVEAGWPEARQLVYDLPEMLR